MKSAIYLSYIFLITSLLGIRNPTSAQELNTNLTINDKWFPFPHIDSAKINAELRYAYSTYPYHNMDSAKALYVNILRESESIGYSNGIIAATSNIAAWYTNKGDYNTSIWYYRKTLASIPKDYPNYQAIASVYTFMGTPYYFLGKYDSAAYYMYKAVDELEHHKITKYGQAVQVYTNVSDLLNTLGEHENALYYSRKAEAIAIHQKDTGALASIYITKGIDYLDENKWDSARYYYTQVFKFKTQYTFQPFYLRKANMGMGASYINQDKPEPSTAIPYLNEALRLSQLGNDPFDILGCYFYLGSAYYKLHDNKAAEKMLQFVCAKPLLKDVKYHYFNIAHSYLSDIYESKGAYKKALSEQKIYKSNDDSFITQDKLLAINKLDVKYRVAEKDKQLAENKLLLLKQKSSLEKKDLWNAIISTSVLLLITLLAFLYRGNKRKQEIHKLKAMISGEEKERSRIARELHDGIGGMLASIQLNLNSVKKEYDGPGVDRIDDILFMLQDTSTEVRKTAHNLMPDILIKHNLIKALEIYCEGINTSGNLWIDLHVNGDFEELDKSIELILYRIIQELTQNIIKHAKADYAAIDITQYDGQLNITIEDNGVGFDIHKHNGGYGLQNLRFRVQGLFGKLNVMSTEGKGTTVHIEFELQKLKNSITI